VIADVGLIYATAVGVGADSHVIGRDTPCDVAKFEPTGTYLPRLIGIHKRPAGFPDDKTWQTTARCRVSSYLQKYESHWRSSDNQASISVLLTAAYGFWTAKVPPLLGKHVNCSSKCSMEVRSR
jgi:hypothetical protein